MANLTQVLGHAHVAVPQVRAQRPVIFNSVHIRRPFLPICPAKGSCLRRTYAKASIADVAPTSSDETSAKAQAVVLENDSGLADDIDLSQFDPQQLIQDQDYRDKVALEEEEEDDEAAAEVADGPQASLPVLSLNPEHYGEGKWYFANDPEADEWQEFESSFGADADLQTFAEYEARVLGLPVPSEGGSLADEGEAEPVSKELQEALASQSEAVQLLKAWSPEALDTLYPGGTVPGFDKKESKDLWRALRYFLALEAIDATAEVHSQTTGEVVEFDDDVFDDSKDAEEDPAVEAQYDMLVQEYDIGFRPQEKVYGTVYKIDEDGAYVELGGKASGYVPLSECSIAKLGVPTEVLQVGSTREFVVVQEMDEYGEVVLSLRELENAVLWQRIQQLREQEITVYVDAVAATKGGLVVTFEDIRGFIPATQFGPKLMSQDMESLTGYQIPVKILEVDEANQRMVFSNRQAGGDADLQGYKVGDVVTGTVQSVKPYGAFVDLGGVTGLLHVSQISHERVLSVEKILNVGDQLKVMILSQDSERGRVTLSTKKLEPSPGDMLRDPQLVFEQAESMAENFRQRVSRAQAAAAAAVGQEGLPSEEQPVSDFNYSP